MPLYALVHGVSINKTLVLSVLVLYDAVLGAAVSVTRVELHFRIVYQ